MPTPRCGNCHREIPPTIHPYTMKIELFPRVEESLKMIEAGLEIDCDEEMKKIIAQLEAMDEEQTKLEEERVYSIYRFVVCPQCRDLLAEQLKRNVVV